MRGEEDINYAVITELNYVCPNQTWIYCHSLNEVQEFHP